MNTPSDSALIRQLQNGGLDALGTLYDRHQRMVYRTALAVTGDPEAAADLLQDVFLRLHRFCSHVDSNRPLEPWLYRVTANLSYTWVKRHNRWIRPLEDLADWFSNGWKQPTMQQQAETDETWQQLQQAVQALPLAHRMVVVMYYVNDLSLEEIAEVLDVPLGTVKSRLYYGRQALKVRLSALDGTSLPEMRYEFT